MSRYGDPDAAAVADGNEDAPGAGAAFEEDIADTVDVDDLRIWHSINIVAVLAGEDKEKDLCYLTI